MAQNIPPAILAPPSNAMVDGVQGHALATVGLLMPYKAARPCRRPHCPETTTDDSGFCEMHRKQRHREYNREQRPAHHKLYNTQRWRDLRIGYLIAHPFCEECGRIATIVHHMTPHNGDVDLFHDPNNLESLCPSCHAMAHDNQPGRGRVES